MAGLRVRQAFGVFLLLGLGVGAPAPSFLGTQPPCATQALIIQGQWILTPKKEVTHLFKKFNYNSYLYILKIMSRYAMLCHMLR